MAFRCIGVDSKESGIIRDNQIRNARRGRSVNGVESLAYDPQVHLVDTINGSSTVDFWGPDGRILATLLVVQNGSTYSYSQVNTRVYFGSMLLGTSANSSGMPNPAMIKTDRLGSANSTYPYGADIQANPPTAISDFRTYDKDAVSRNGYANQR